MPCLFPHGKCALKSNADIIYSYQVEVFEDDIWITEKVLQSIITNNSIKLIRGLNVVLKPY